VWLHSLNHPERAAPSRQDIDSAVQPSESPDFSVIVPCYNERDAIAETVDYLFRSIGGDRRFELVVVDDGSQDGSGEILDKLVAQYPALIVYKHDFNRGYGAALKTGISRANSELVVITDADGTYPNERIPELVGMMATTDMVVGARTAKDVTYSKLRSIPKAFLRTYASWIAGQRIPDMNSGLRVMRKSIVTKFLNILPDSFSFTTTITMAMLTNYYRVHYEPVSYKTRIGKSKIRPIRDTIRFTQLIVRTGMYFAPLRVFLPIGLLLATGTTISLFNDVFILRDLTERTLILALFAMNTIMFSLLADMIDKRTAR